MFHLLPFAYCMITLYLEKRLGPSHEQTHQRHKTDTPKGGTVLMHPNLKSQTETGSRQQKYFLNKSNELFATGNVDKPTGAVCQSRYTSCLFWVTGHHHPPITASAGAAEGT